MYREANTELTGVNRAPERVVIAGPATAVAEGATETTETRSGHAPALADPVAGRLPEIAATVRAGLTVPAARTRSALDAGDAYPAIDPFRLADHQIYGRRLQGQVLGEAIGRWLAGLRDAIATPSPAARNRERSALDAGAAYPAVDPQRLAVQQLRSRRLQARVTGDLIDAGLRKLGRAVKAGLVRAFTPAPATLEAERLQAYGWGGALDVPPDYQKRVSLFYGRGL